MVRGDHPRVPTIRALPPADRPRERLRALGVEALSGAELIALLIGSGTRTQSATDVAAALLDRGGGSLRRLAQTPLATLASVAGVGPVRALTIQAALDLGRRLAAEPTESRPPMRGPDDVFRFYGPRLSGLGVEEFHVAVLDAQHRLERDLLISRGILDGSLVHPREVFREAIAERAAAVILVHNHPSGDPTPSAEDQAVTRQLVAAGRLLDIPVHDHIVIGRGRYVSLAQEGRLL